jgi:hypothetical protein
MFHPTSSFNSTLIPDALGSRPSATTNVGLIVGTIIGLLVGIAVVVTLCLFVSRGKSAEEQESEVQYETESQLTDFTCDFDDDLGSADGGELLDELDDMVAFAEDETMFDVEE